MYALLKLGNKFDISVTTATHIVFVMTFAY